MGSCQSKHKHVGRNYITSPCSLIISITASCLSLNSTLVAHSVWAYLSFRSICWIVSTSSNTVQLFLKLYHSIIYFYSFNFFIAPRFKSLRHLFFGQLLGYTWDELWKIGFRVPNWQRPIFYMLQIRRKDREWEK